MQCLCFAVCGVLVLQVLRKLELFAGGCGLSFMAQEMEGCGAIVSCWANDINPSACATYAANKPYTFVSPLLADSNVLVTSRHIQQAPNVVLAWACQQCDPSLPIQPLG